MAATAGALFTSHGDAAGVDVAGLVDDTVGLALGRTVTVGPVRAERCFVPPVVAAVLACNIIFNSDYRAGVYM